MKHHDETGSRRISLNAVKPPSAERASVWILAVTAVVAPLALGASGIWPRFALEAAIVVAGSLWAASGSRSVWMTGMPVVVAGLVLLQLLPIPDSMLVTLAPVSAGAWKLAHHGIPNAWGGISVDPGATLVATRRLLLFLTTVAMVADLGRRQSHRKRLMAAVAVSGAFILMTGLMFGHAKDHHLLGFINLAGPIQPNLSPVIAPVQSSGVGQAEWVNVTGQRYQVDCSNVGDGFGSYIYSNHFAGGTVLTVPLLLAWWLSVSQRRLNHVLRWLVALGFLTLTICTVGPLAGSKAGAGAAALAGLVLIAITAESPALRWPSIAALCVYGAASVVFVVIGLTVLMGAGDEIVGQLSEPWRKGVAALLVDPRIVSAHVALRMFAASPLLGTGLDTYQDIFPRFYQNEYTLFYAHNDYAQLLAETGLAGAAVATSLVVVLARRCLRFCVGSKGDYRILNAGPWAALAGIAAHSAFDWNLHLPANAFLACLVAGLSASSVPASPAAWVRDFAARVPDLLPRSLLVGAIVLSLGFLARDAASEAVQRRVREAIVDARLLSMGNNTMNHDFRRSQTRLLQATTAADLVSGWDRRNALLALRLGQAHLHVADDAANAAEREKLLGTASRWFVTAKNLCAACRGLPEQLAPKVR